MNPANSTSISKTFNAKGKMGEKYNISFWYKDEGFYASGKVGDPICNNVVIQYNYTDSANDTGHCILTSKVFNPNDSDWQYYSINFQAEYDFDSVTLTFYQEKNANNMYITNLYLYKDTLEISCSYDINGNVTSIFDLDNESSSAKYDSKNQLVKITDSKGKNFTYEYDNMVTNMGISRISDSGICNVVKYNNNENPITTRTINSIVGELTETDCYNIRLKGTENYLCKNNNEIVISSDSNHDLWKLEKEDGYYKIKHSILNNLYLNVKNSKLVLDTTYTLFEITKQDNNSFMVNQKYVEEIGGIPKMEALIYLKEENGSLAFDKYIYDDYHYQFYFEIPHEKFLEQNAIYNDDNRFIKSVTDTNLNKVSYDIDETTGLINSVTNPKGNTVNYYYDEKKRISSIIDYNKVIQYRYNFNNVLCKISDDQREYNLIYDKFLNLKDVKIGNTITLITNEYEENNGNLLKETYGNGDSISYAYDEFDRVKSVTKMNDTYKYYYDNNGDIEKVISNNKTYKFKYDLSKKLSEYCSNNYINYKDDNGTKKKKQKNKKKKKQQKKKKMVNSGLNSVKSKLKGAISKVSNFISQLHSSITGTAGSSLLYSMTLSPKNQVYTFGDSLSKQIKKSTVYNDKMNSFVKNYSNAEFNDDYIGRIIFDFDENLNLGTTIHEASLYVSGQIIDGKADLLVRVHDKYDFAYSGYKGGIKGAFIATINNVAYALQEISVINNYNIDVYVRYTSQ